MSTHPLELVVGSAPHVLMGIADDRHHPLCRLTFIQVQSEPVLQPFDRGFTLEGRQAGVKHQLHRAHELVCVRPDREERLHCKLLEELVAL